MAERDQKTYGFNPDVDFGRNIDSNFKPAEGTIWPILPDLLCYVSEVTHFAQRFASLYAGPPQPERRSKEFPYTVTVS